MTKRSWTTRSFTITHGQYNMLKRICLSLVLVVLGIPAVGQECVDNFQAVRMAYEDCHSHLDTVGTELTKKTIDSTRRYALECTDPTYLNNSENNKFVEKISELEREIHLELHPRVSSALVAAETRILEFTKRRAEVDHTSVEAVCSVDNDLAKEYLEDAPKELIKVKIALIKAKNSNLNAHESRIKACTAIDEDARAANHRSLSRWVLVTIGAAIRFAEELIDSDDSKFVEDQQLGQNLDAFGARVREGCKDFLMLNEGRMSDVRLVGQKGMSVSRPVWE